MNWRFEPEQREIQVRLGERTLALFRATNLAPQEVTGTATFNVLPAKVGAYFDKIQCFCFTEQRLSAGQSTELPVTFFIDPSMAADPEMDDVATITLAYTFFPKTSKGGS